MNVQSEIAGKKEAILRSAMELIRLHGFHGTPMSQIARHANVACGTIYHYFPGKDDVMLEIYLLICKELSVVAFGARDISLSFKDQFFEECRKLLHYYISNPDALYFLDQYNNSPYAQRTLEAKQVFIDNFFNFMRMGMEEGVVKKVEYFLVAPVVLGAISTTAKVHVSGRREFSPDSVNNILAIIWDGIRL